MKILSLFTHPHVISNSMTFLKLSSLIILATSFQYNEIFHKNTIKQSVQAVY